MGLGQDAESQKKGDLPESHGTTLEGKNKVITYTFEF